MWYGLPNVIGRDHVDSMCKGMLFGILTGKPSMFVIKNKEIAKGFLNYFNYLWNSGKQ